MWDIISSFTHGMNPRASMENEMKTLNALTQVLIIVGGLNWGLVGVAKFDLVATLFGAGSFLSNTVYTLVGISAVYQALRLASPSRSGAMATSH